MKETKKQLNNLKETVLKAIEEDKVSMHSKLYFLSRSALWALGFLLTLTLTIYLISFITFIFRGNSLHLLPQLGPGGWFNLFVSLPWVLLLIVFSVFVLLQVLSTHFSFVYKRPLVHTLLASIFLVVIVGVAIAQTSFHERAYERHKEGFMYKGALKDKGEIHIGRVTQINGAGFNIRNREGETYIVSVTPTTKMPPFKISTSTIMIVMGAEDNGVITAVGIRPVQKQRRVK